MAHNEFWRLLALDTSEAITRQLPYRMAMMTRAAEGPSRKELLAAAERLPGLQ